MRISKPKEKHHAKVTLNHYPHCQCKDSAGKARLNRIAGTTCGCFAKNNNTRNNHTGSEQMSGNNFNGALNPAYTPDELEKNHKNAHEAGTQPKAADDTIVDIADVSKYGKTSFFVSIFYVNKIVSLHYYYFCLIILFTICFTLKIM